MKITILNKLIFKSVKGCDSYFKVKFSKSLQMKQLYLALNMMYYECD